MKAKSFRARVMKAITSSMLDVIHLLLVKPAKPVDQKQMSTSGHVQYSNTFAQLDQGKVRVDSRCYHRSHWFPFSQSRSTYVGLTDE